MSTPESQATHKPRNKWQSTFGSLSDERCPDGLIPADAEAQGKHGFVYGVTIMYPRSGASTKVYIGSRTFTAGWKTYRTSSAEVKEIIEDSQRYEGGPVIELEILAYADSRWQLHQTEDAWIVAAKNKMGTRCLNRATSTGAKLGEGKNKYRKPRKEPYGGSNVAITG